MGFAAGAAGTYLVRVLVPILEVWPVFPQPWSVAGTPVAGLAADAEGVPGGRIVIRGIFPGPFTGTSFLGAIVFMNGLVLVARL
jgi:hypothetical protein